MSALPSEPTAPDALHLTVVSDLTFADVAGSEPSAIKKAVEAESVWLTKAAAGGHGLRSEDLLRYTVGVDRADNTTGMVTWRTRLIDARCGISTVKTSRSTTALLNKYISAGLLASDAVTALPGQALRVRIDRAAAKDSLRIPLGILWEYRWAEGITPTGPRYGTDTRLVLVWLAAWLLTAEYDKSTYRYTSTETFLGLPVPARWIAKKAGISLATYRRAWDTVRRVCADAPWITWCRDTRPDDAHDAYRISIDWSLAPVLKTVPSAATPTSNEQGGPPSSEQGGPPSSERGVSPSKDQGVPPQVSALSSTSACGSTAFPPVPAADTTKDVAAAATSTSGGKAEKFKPPVADADLAAALTGRRPAAAAAPTATNAAVEYRPWLLALIAAITNPTRRNHMVMTSADVESLHDALSAPYNVGWHTDALATQMTVMSAPQHVVGALKGRIATALTQPVNSLPTPGYQTAAEKKREEEERAYQEAASSRSPDKYYRRTM
ncbi:hypothetical protein AB0N29_19590 [Nocardioides sp. NPDC092400]|uniref:hypothetical protein n=1 Tax=Nocardioides sp. NPDC092400 TaxID=3155196 RepID=UPI00341E9670